ncbi:hypothetical protein PVK06_042222 [Gossypium arboreum]|uniref:RNase H type-1 domain-containing protein n=1 Tax=Gossypium arboreum TaxID=29729 RepID=A0ABR0MKJ3_GOSAR|nr:hypothetical protein PVK06_042222 [Gossypium arboreum]
MRKASSGLHGNLGAGKVLLEVDNLAVVKVLGGCSGDETELNVVCRSIKEMLKRNWEVQVHHTYWEGNALANLNKLSKVKYPQWNMKTSMKGIWLIVLLKRFASGRRRVIWMWSWTQFRLQETFVIERLFAGYWTSG